MRTSMGVASPAGGTPSPNPQGHTPGSRAPRVASNLSSLCASKAILTVCSREHLAETPWNCGHHGRPSGL